MSLRGKIQVIRRGCYGTPALIAFDSLPSHIKTSCLEKYGNPRKNMFHDNFKAAIEYDQKAYEYFSNYILADGRFFSPEVRDLYYNTATVLNAMHKTVSDRKLLIKSMGGNTKHVWPILAATVMELKKEIQHDLPENYRRLQDKYNKYMKDGYQTLISGKWLNRNSASVKDIEQEAVLRQLFAKGNNFNNEQVRMLYNMVAEKSDWDKISASTIANYRTKWDLRTVSGRRGETYFDNNKVMQIKRKPPVLPLVYWTADGWDVELLFQKSEINSQGNSITTYHNRLNAVIILDPCCKYPIGYAVGESESPALIRQAFRNAINHTKELFGQRHRVHQLQTDNYSRKNLTPFYEGLTKLYTPARLKNSKSKVIEPRFRYLNVNYCQFMPNWSGFGVTSKKENQPNTEYLNKNRHSFPDENGVRKQIEHIIEMERKSKIQKYKAAYQELPETDRLLISDTEFILNLGEITGFTNKLTAAGLIVKIDGDKHEYDCFDRKFRELSETDWAVKYDPEDKSKIIVLNAKSNNGKLIEIIGTQRFELEEKYVQPMALYDQTETDRAALKEVRNFNKALKSEVFEGLKQDYQIVDGFFNEHPQLEGTLTKLILVDSNGQHKDNKSAARLNASAVKMIEKHTKTDKKEAETSWNAQQEAYLEKKVDINKYL